MLCELDESLEEFPELAAYLLVGQIAILVEDLTRARDQQPAAELGACAEGAQHREPGVLSEYRAEAAQRCADHRDRALPEDLGNIRRRPRQPVDGVMSSSC